MHSFSPITIFWAEYPALSLAAESGLKTRHAPSARRLAHRVLHRAAHVRCDVRHVMRDAVRGKALPEYSLWAAGARPVPHSGQGCRPFAPLKTPPASALSASNPRLYCARPKPASLFRALTGHPLARAKVKTQEAGKDGNWLRALANGISEDARPRSRARLAAYSLGFPRS